jgi:hypothetical protein
MLLFLVALREMRNFEDAGCRMCSAAEFVSEEQCHLTGYIGGGGRSAHIACVPVLMDTYLVGLRIVLVLMLTSVNLLLLYRIWTSCFGIRCSMGQYGFARGESAFGP